MMARTPTDSTRINYYQPNDVLNALKKLAARRGTTYSELIRMATREYALREVRKEREAMADAAE